MTNAIRRCIFRPYLQDKGPIFYLTILDSTYRDGRDYLTYRLTMREPGKPLVTLFEGSDFGCSPIDSIDGNDAVVALMGFLTLRPGDTDAEYFAEYTDVQRDFCDRFAETLSCEVDARFCDENGNVRKGRR